MSFVEPVFLVFLGLVVLALGTLPLRWVRVRQAALLVASLGFYGWREHWLVLLLLISIVIDWAAALLIERRPAHTQLWVGLSLSANLGMLGLFKYADFLLANLHALLPAAAAGLPTQLGLPLPLGISFFTFQSMAYTLDVAAGRVAARRSPLTVAAYVALFPQLIAGPIERASALMPQLERPQAPTAADRARGIDLLVWGAVQKLVVADSVSLYVDAVFAREQVGGAALTVAVLGFMVQILADFAGYTCMARGAGRLLGIRLRRNFDRPYLAPSPSAFWRRWHMSFSSWMHTYVYRPLAGPRRGGLRQAAATVASLCLAGLWHGAAWHFVAWGLWFSVVVLAWRPLRRPLAARPWLATSLTFGAVAVGMLLFRAPSLRWLARAVVPTAHDGIVALALVPVLAAGALVLAVGGALQRRALAPMPRALLWAAGALLAFTFARDTAHDFVYFRF